MRCPLCHKEPSWPKNIYKAMLSDVGKYGPGFFFYECVSCRKMLKIKAEWKMGFEIYPAKEWQKGSW